MNSDVKNGRFRRIKAFWKRKVHWLTTHTSERNYQIVVAIIIGLASGLAAVVLKFSVVSLRNLIYSADPSHWNVWFVFSPTLGVMLGVFYIRYVLRKPLEIGVSGLIKTISRRRYRIPKYETYAHIISSSFTVGFGGSLGLEAPLFRTGSALGSNIASSLHAVHRRQTLFLGCGIAGSMAAIFNSPVAGVLFAYEAVLVGTALYSFVPLLIASVSGAVLARVLYYEQLFYLPTSGWEASTIPYFILLGVGSGLMSTFMMRAIFRIQEYFGDWKKQRYKTLIGGLLLGGLIFLFPPLFGEGYDTVNLLLQGSYTEITNHSVFYQWSDNTWVLLLYMVLLLFTKSVAAAVTMGMGGNGGVFAPSMFSGAVLGFLLAFVVNYLGIAQLHVQDFVAVGMGGVLSGLLKTPLTSIFLIAEITGGYLLFVPLMLVSAISYFVSQYFEPHSFFTKQLYLKGVWVPSHQKDRQVLKQMELMELVETNFSKVHQDDTFGTLVSTIAQCHRNIFPVVDHENNLVGILTLDDVRDIMFKSELYDQLKVQQLMYDPPAVLSVNNSMEQVMKCFEQTQAWNLPVVDQAGKYLGFVSKSSIFEKYRELLQEVSEEN